MCAALSLAIQAGARAAVEFPTEILLRGDTETESAPHGKGNVYAPEVHQEGNRWRMWYGGQGRDGHDRIHLAESDDGATWTKRGVVIDCGDANHVNDPTVARVTGLWWMFYTVAKTGEADEIAAATSPDGVAWKKQGVVLPRGPAHAWDSWKVGRPSVLYENGIFRLWFDGQATPEAAAADPMAAEVKRAGIAVGYAESRDGLKWERRPRPVFLGASAVQVARWGTGYVLVSESSKGVNWAESKDGFTWTAHLPLTGLSRRPEDAHGRVTPFLIPEASGAYGRLFFGAAAERSWDHNSIASQRVILSDDR